MKRRTVATAIALVVLITAGCGHYGALTKDYGNSYNRAKQGQILNPAASNNLAPVTGLPAKAAEATMMKYIDSFAPPQGAASQGAQSLLMTPISSGVASGTGQNAYGQ